MERRRPTSASRHGPSSTSSPPSRVTRSAARRSDPPVSQPPQTAPPPPSPTSRKRKAAAREQTPPGASDEAHQEASQPPPHGSRVKRTRVEPEAAVAAPPSTRSKKGKAKSAMSSVPGPSTEGDDARGQAAPSSARRGKSGRSSSGLGDRSLRTSRRASKKSAAVPDDDVDMDDAPDTMHQGHRDRPATASDHHPLSDSEESGPGGRYDEDNDDDDDDDDLDGHSFAESMLRQAAGLGRGAHSFAALRALAGVYQGQQAQFRTLLEKLRSKDLGEQSAALTELRDLLLMANEDTLAGGFQTDAFVKELVAFLQPNEHGEHYPDEMMLLACGCLANLMEALPAATGNVVYSGAVPLLCARLLEISYMDVAEQALSTLRKISVEFPAAIVRAGGLRASLAYLDFFPTNVQRMAVTTAANCCRNIPEELFLTVLEVMPILENILSNSDQVVLEQGCICVSRIVQSFRHYDGKLEELVSAELLHAILRLLLPGTTNLIGANIHTMFLQVLAYTAKASPRRSAELFKMNVVDTLYQILTGVSPPSGTEGVSTKIDTVIIMQALIHRPKDQVYETLNVICELLPGVAHEGLLYVDDLVDAGYPGEIPPPLSARTKSSNETRVNLLKDCQNEVRRFAVVLMPTLTDAYSSTVNFNVRQKVLTAQLKMLSNLDVEILEEALRPVPYASYLASIFSQQDHPSLVTYALQAAELLLERLGHIYRYQFYREGVIAEISKLADRPCKSIETRPKHEKPDHEIGTGPGAGVETSSEVGLDHDEGDDFEIDMHSEDDVDDGHDLDDEHQDQSDDNRDPEDDSDSSSMSDRYIPPPTANLEDVITLRAKKFIEVHETDNAKDVRDKASKIMENLQNLAAQIRTSALKAGSMDCKDLFIQLAAYFDGDALESITSYELMTSGIANVLLETFSTPPHSSGVDPRSVFLEALMGSNTAHKTKTASSTSPATPFSVLITKLQDLLSRAEHFEVITVHQHSYDSRSSATSMLAKQLRLKLVADDDSGIPKPFRNIMVSIHAIATFKALDDYLRSRLSLSDRPRGSRHRDYLAYTAALAEGRSPGPPPPHTPKDSNRSTSRKSSRSKPEPPSPSAEAQAGPSSSSQQKPRRYSRRQETQTQAPPPPPPPPPPPALARSSRHGEPVECPDEERISDNDSLDDQSALEALVDDMDDDLEGMEDDGADPSAVNVEVASTGKVTARKDDGTRVATPVQGQTPAKSPSSERHQGSAQGLSALLGASALRQGLGSSAGALSYAAAVQTTPQNWHIEFSVNDRPIPNDTTIYRAVHFSQPQQPDASHRTVWNFIHSIKFRRVPGPPPSETSPWSPYPEATRTGKSDLPQSLDRHPITADILRLLGILHEMNSNLDDILSDNREQIKLNVEPLSQFVNTKLTAKLNRQLEEPLIVASNCLPSWSEDLARLYPFLFPFETRHLFLQSTSFGYSRSMTRWQNSQRTNDARHDRRDERPFLGRLQRQKVRISRPRMLESALKVMEMYGSSPSILEVEYFGEVGTGLGPTLEFYSCVSNEFSKKSLKLWRENESSESSEYAFGRRGLFPAPMSAQEAETENGQKQLHMFKMLGKFVARSMLDSRIIDLSFNPTFFRVGDGTATVTPSLGAVSSVDSDLARSLKLLRRFANTKKKIDEDTSLDVAQKVQAIQEIEIDGARVEDMELDFTLPGYPIELVENGAEKSVTIDNVDLYVERVLDFTIGCGVQRQVNAFREGFSLVFPYSALKAFTPDELVMLFGRANEDWSLETLMDSIKADHGYNLDSKSIRNLLQVMSEFTQQERRDFLQFITGSPKLPIGGFKSLTPMFTVVCKPSEPPYTSDDYLPSVMTCVNYLKMPDYSDISVLREKLNVAIKEGQGAFHLS